MRKRQSVVDGTSSRESRSSHAHGACATKFVLNRVFWLGPPTRRWIPNASNEEVNTSRDLQLSVVRSVGVFQTLARICVCVFCVSNPLRYLAQAAYGGVNADNWGQLSSAEEQRFVILGGKVRDSSELIWGMLQHGEKKML